MASAGHLLAVVLTGLLVGGVTPMWAPYVDTPYEEIVAHRFKEVGMPQVAGWGMYPFSNVTQVVPVNPDQSLLPSLFSCASKLILQAIYLWIGWGVFSPSSHLSIHPQIVGCNLGGALVIAAQVVIGFASLEANRFPIDRLGRQPHLPPNPRRVFSLRAVLMVVTTHKSS